MCQENKRHKYADILIAIAEGKTVQFLTKGDNGRWVDFKEDKHGWPGANGLFEWRIKPKPPVKKYLWVYKYKSQGCIKVSQFYFATEEEFLSTENWNAFEYIYRVHDSEREFPAT